MDELISRQAAIDAHCELCGDRGRCNCDICPDVEVFQLLPSAQPDLDEWCTDCKEYDQERHCCPRFNRVIRKTVEEVRQNAQPEPRWIPVTERLPKESDGVVLITVSGKVTTGQYSEFSKRWYKGDMCGVGGDDPIAWMPLPKPYERSEE